GSPETRTPRILHRVGTNSDQEHNRGGRVVSARQVFEGTETVRGQAESLEQEQLQPDGLTWRGQASTLRQDRSSTV
ncbi:MAG: hypothetical protein ACO4AU_08460, partial [bacterium]